MMRTAARPAPPSPFGLPGLLTWLLTLLCAASLHAQAPARLSGSPLPEDTRVPGDWNLQAGVGAVNGARLGAAYMVSSVAAAELSAGYVRIQLLEENNTTTSTPGLALSVGGSLYLHPEYEISPNASLLFTAVTSTNTAERYQRYAVTATVGTEYYVLRSVFCFLRFGVSVQRVIDPHEAHWQTDPQFDGGIGYAFH